MADDTSTPDSHPPDLRWRLDGRVALVTGASSGLGARFARVLHQAGATVLVTARRGDRLDELAAECGERIETMTGDITDARHRQALAERLQPHGRLDVLVNNAGVIDYDGIVDVTPEAWSRVLGVDQNGVFLGIRTALGPMLRQQSGSIINMSSAWGVVGSEGVAAYQAAKGAVRGLTRNAAITYARQGVRVNTVIPGWIATPLTDSQPAEKNAEVIGLTPMGFGAEPLDIAYGCLFLAGDESRYMTGAELVIDGGLLAR
jgi:NAD(P)-dependent dehydrogenase (short-subunit alcohol dehydrogenase family)